MKITQIPVPHFSKRTDPGIINAIVIHATANRSSSETLNWFENKASGVSSHYVIDKNGDIIQCVSDTDKAWHAGDSDLWGVPNANEFSIGIELVNLNNDKDEYTPEQMASLIELCTELCSTYNIPLNRVVGHQDISPGRKTDPGKQFPWKEFLIALGGHLA